MVDRRIAPVHGDDRSKEVNNARSVWIRMLGVLGRQTERRAECNADEFPGETEERDEAVRGD